MNSENVYSALATLLGSIGGFVTVERKWQMVEDVDPTAMPYMGIKERLRQVYARSSDGIEAWKLTCDVIVYVNNPNTAKPSSPIFNPLIDAICNALPPIALPLPQTTGGVQFNAYIPPGQQIVYYENWLDGKSVVHVPIEIIAPDNA